MPGAWVLVWIYETLSAVMKMNGTLPFIVYTEKEYVPFGTYSFTL